MNTGLFYLNLKTIDELLVSTEIASAYSTMIPEIIAYRNSPTEETKADLDESIEIIEDRLATINTSLSKLPHSNLLLDELGVESILSPYTDSLTTVIYSDLFTADQRMQTTLNDIQVLQATIKQITGGFENLQYKIETEPAANLFTIEFGGDTEITSIKDLIHYSKKIELILHSYASVSTDLGENTPIIQSVSKNSPLAIDISWPIEELPNILKLIGLTVLFYLQQKKESIKITEYEELLVQTAPTAGANKKIKKGFEETRDGLLDEKAIEKHVKELLMATKNKPSDRTIDEQKTYLTRGAEELMELLNDGARVEVYAESDTTEESNSEPNQTTLIYRSYRQIEEKKSLLNANMKLKLPKNTLSKSDEEG